MHPPLLAVLVVVGGCGGGSGTSTVAASSTGRSVPNTTKVAATSSRSASEHKSTTSPARRSRPDAARVFPASFVTTTDAICARMNSEFEAHKPKSDTLQEIARLSPLRAALEQRTVVELSKLSPPPPFMAEWRRVVGYRRTLADELKRLGVEAKLGDGSAITALAASKKREHEVLHREALRDGLYGCAFVG